MNRLQKKISVLHGLLFLFLFSISCALLIPTTADAGEMESNPEYAEAVANFYGEKYDRAFVLFYDLFKAAPENTRINFFLGRSAFETGDYETAVFAFERILIAEPDNLRVRLEMARCYWRLGSMEEASRLFRQVLDSDPPRSVKANIEPYLKAIDASRKRNFFRLTATTGVNVDDNLNVSPVDDIVEIPGLEDLPVKVDGAESGYYVPLNLEFRHRYHFEGFTGYWKNTIQTYHTRYPGHDDLEVDYFSFVTGCGMNLGLFEVGVFPEVYSLLLDSQRYSWAVGSRLQCIYSPAYNQRATMTGFIRTKAFDDISERDSLETGIDFKYAIYGGKAMVMPNVYYKQEAADDDLYGYDRVGAGISISLPLPFQVDCFGGYYFEQDEYEGEDDLFLTTRRDRTHAVTAGLSKQFELTDHVVFMAGVAHTWETVDSNIALYEYDRNVTRFYISLVY